MPHVTGVWEEPPSPPDTRSGPGDGYRAPAPGEPVHPTDQHPSGAVFLVTYCDEHYPFTEGSWGRFGRDDSVCEIPVWEAINTELLSRVAGELWCADGELWVRNLSRTHELSVAGTCGPPQWLPRRDAHGRGPACSVSGRQARISAPSTGWWELVAETSVPAGPQGEVPVATVNVDPVPEPLMPVAAALCAPILQRSQPAATYDQVAQSLQITRRQARRQVERLCECYADLPLLADGPARDAKASPAYADLALLLVRRGRVALADVHQHLGCPS